MSLVEAVDEVDVRCRTYADKVEEEIVEKVQQKKASKVSKTSLTKWAKRQLPAGNLAEEVEKMRKEPVEADHADIEVPITTRDRL